ncbi:hypothetical protein [Enterobacter roggenkampii]|uniref:hypothetical protein n=1 Tax=Enterobacter roggenkampii TaxID=1812935 RepID=UPI000BA8CE6D|nr:hypothetical protein [Enterobacter roggenkampii]PAO24643.1 hypothetical protein CIW56_01575 [Enterobacter roggenkampii]
MLKRTIEKLISRKFAQRFPSKNFDSSQEGFIIIASPEDIVELITTPELMSEPLLKKIIFTAVKELDRQSTTPAKMPDKKL